MKKRKKSCNWIIITILILLLGISVGYSALSSMLSMSGEVIVTPHVETTYPVNYAVQIYGINEDVDASDNPIGLTFGPATGDNYNNKYVTHTYEETSPGSGEYYVKIITHTVASNGSETTTEEFLTNSAYENVTRTEEQKNKYDINLHEMTWTQIAAVSDKTDFLDCILCGNTKKVELSLNGTIGTGITPTQYGDGTGILDKTINKYYKEWNPAANENSAVGTNVTLDINEQSFGSNARNAGGITEGLGNNGHGYSKFSSTDSKDYVSHYYDSAFLQRVCFNEANNSSG